jgi:hypothetical protein
VLLVLEVNDLASHGVAHGPPTVKWSNKTRAPKFDKNLHHHCRHTYFAGQDFASFASQYGCMSRASHPVLHGKFSAD